MWLSMSAASLEMRAASSRTICLRSVRGRRSSPWATPRSPAAFSRAVAAKSVRLAACAIRLSLRREAEVISRRSTVVCPIASPVLAPLSGRTAHGRRETNETRAGCPRSPVLRRPPIEPKLAYAHPTRSPATASAVREIVRHASSPKALGQQARSAARTDRMPARAARVRRPARPPGGVNTGIAANRGAAGPVRADTQATNHT